MLDIASFNDASTAAFGGTLCNNLTTATKDIIGNKSDVQALPIFWAATMFAALYKGYGSHWHVAAYAAARCARHPDHALRASPGPEQRSAPRRGGHACWRAPIAAAFCACCVTLA